MAGRYHRRGRAVGKPVRPRVERRRRRPEASFDPEYVSNRTGLPPGWGRWGPAKRTRWFNRQGALFFADAKKLNPGSPHRRATWWRSKGPQSWRPRRWQDLMIGAIEARTRDRPGKIPAWAKRPLSSAEFSRLRASRSQVPLASMIRAMGKPVTPRLTSILRAMGIRLTPPKLNPRGGSMARSRTKRATAQADLDLRPMVSAGAAPKKRTRRHGMAAKFRAAGHVSRRRHPVHGPLMASGFFDPSSQVTKKRRARGRGRAVVYGPVQSASLYKARSRRKPRRKAAARRRPGTKRRTAAQRRAFTRMMAGLRRYHASRRRGRPAAKRRRSQARRGYPAISARARYSGSARPPKGFRSRRHRASARRKQGHKNLKATRPIRPGQMVAGLVRRNNPRRGGQDMARRRRHNPGRRRRHNPGGMRGAINTVIKAGVPGAVGGAVSGLLDSKIIPEHWGTLGRVGVKTAVAAIAGMVLRKHPLAAASAIGGMLGTASYEATVRAIGGGVVAATRPAGMRELAAMAAEDEGSLGLLEQELHGFGLLEDGASGMGDATPDLGDVEPSLGDDFEGFGDELTD
jgi:hypothetical protein